MPGIKNPFKSLKGFYFLRCLGSLAILMYFGFDLCLTDPVSITNSRFWSGDGIFCRFDFRPFDFAPPAFAGFAFSIFKATGRSWLLRVAYFSFRLPVLRRQLSLGLPDFSFFKVAGRSWLQLNTAFALDSLALRRWLSPVLLFRGNFIIHMTFKKYNRKYVLFLSTYPNSRSYFSANYHPAPQMGGVQSFWRHKTAQVPFYASKPPT